MDYTREQHAMEYHQRIQKQWAATGRQLSAITGRDPSTLSMFSDDTTRTISEERFLIDQVLGSMVTKELGVWQALSRIGDIYAQPDKPRLTNFETIRNPELVTGAEGERPADFLRSKYYKKRVKELRSYIEKIRPFNTESDGLIVIGKPLGLADLESAPESAEAEAEVSLDAPLSSLQAESVVRASMTPNRLVFLTTPGETQSKSVKVVNEGTTAIYYKWEIVREVDLMTGLGADRVPVRNVGPDGELVDRFDWSASDGFTMPRNQRPRTRSEFCFTQFRGSIRPGCSVDFEFVFTSDVPGCFIQKWLMQTIPTIKGDSRLTVALRGCCAVEPPNLTAFKQSIDNSLHESERTRCIEEVLASVFERVSQVCALHQQGGEERIEGDVLVDDRAPTFEEANKKWALRYSPGLYSSLQVIAERCWDALGLTGFDRFWDMRVESLTQMAMRIRDAADKRAILADVNHILSEATTAAAPGNLTFSLSYVQLSTYLEDLPSMFMRDAAKLGVILPFFVVPKVPDPAELEEALESQRRKHRRTRERKPPPKKPARKGKGEPDSGRGSTPIPEPIGEMRAELKAVIRDTIRDELKRKLLVFEHLAGESQGVAQQLTRVNDLERLDTNLAPEVDDGL
jgi:hypothetical protein